MIQYKISAHIIHLLKVEKRAIILDYKYDKISNVDSSTTGALQKTKNKKKTQPPLIIKYQLLQLNSLILEAPSLFKLAIYLCKRELGREIKDVLATYLLLKRSDITSTSNTEFSWIQVICPEAVCGTIENFLDLPCFWEITSIDYSLVFN